MAARSKTSLGEARLLRYLKPGEAPCLEAAQRIERELRVPLAYLFSDSDGLAQWVLAFGLLSERQQRAVLAQIKRHLFPSGPGLRLG